MKIECVCGAMIVDQCEELPNKAHIIPDDNYWGLLRAIDDAITKSGPSAAAREAAALTVVDLVINMSKSMYQCGNCGRVYIDGPAPTFNTYQFNPNDGTIPRELLKSQLGSKN